MSVYSLVNINLASFDERGNFFEVKNTSIVIEDEIISGMGEVKGKIIDLEGRAVIPGFVDSHTHLVYSGCRCFEYRKPYLEKLKMGGGIYYTVKKTKEEKTEKLLEDAYNRAMIMLRNGTTTLEIKTGYGIEIDEELRELEIIEKLKEILPQDVFITFLIHVPPKEGDRREYLEEITSLFPRIKHRIDFVDIFVDEGAFTIDEARFVFERAKREGIPIKVHADELEYTGASEVAAEFDAVSADHLIKIKEKGIKSLKEKDVVACFLPCTSYFMGKEFAPFRKIIDSGVKWAIATDHNPGTSPCLSMIFAINLACNIGGLRVEEGLGGATWGGAMALRKNKDEKLKFGIIAPQKQADLVILDADSYIHLAYEFNPEIIKGVIKKGKIVWWRK